MRHTARDAGVEWAGSVESGPGGAGERVRVRTSGHLAPAVNQAGQPGVDLPLSPVSPPAHQPTSLITGLVTAVPAAGCHPVFTARLPGIDLAGLARPAARSGLPRTKTIRVLLTSFSAWDCQLSVEILSRPSSCLLAAWQDRVGCRLVPGCLCKGYEEVAAGGCAGLECRHCTAPDCLSVCFRMKAGLVLPSSLLLSLLASLPATSAQQNGGFLSGHTTHTLYSLHLLGLIRVTFYWFARNGIAMHLLGLRLVNILGRVSKIICVFFVENSKKGGFGHSTSLSQNF